MHYKAKSALLLGASTPAGEKRGSFIKTGSSSPFHFIEYGGLETMASKGSSSNAEDWLKCLRGYIKFIIINIMTKHVNSA